MHLVDYKVRVINSEAATAAGVRVVIESRDDHDVWGTVGVSENVIEASWTALVDSFEYKLCKDESRQNAAVGSARGGELAATCPGAAGHGRACRRPPRGKRMATSGRRRVRVTTFFQRSP